MSEPITIRRKVHFRSAGSDPQVVMPLQPQIPLGRIARVSRLLALAIRFDGLLRDGAVADRAQLARLGRVTRARVTQIMNLLNLVPGIQEEILFLPRATSGREVITERTLRPIAAQPDWKRQRRMWAELKRLVNE